MIRMGMKIVAADGTLTREGYEMLVDLQRDLTAFQASLTTTQASLTTTQGKIAAAAAVAAPTGGATIDAQSRTAINAIRAALA